MTTPTDYPLFIPPPPLYEKSHFDWTLAEARAYQAWMLGQLSPRTEALWALLGEDQADPPAAWTERVGRELARLVVQAPFSEGGRLTNQGYALGADAGLLIARALLANHPACGGRSCASPSGTCPSTCLSWWEWDRCTSIPSEARSPS